MPLGKTSAAVLLKLFINENDRLLTLKITHILSINGYKLYWSF